MHPAADRLLQYRRYKHTPLPQTHRHLQADPNTHTFALRYLKDTDTAGFKEFDETWDYTHDSMAPSDTGTVCDWDGINDGDETLPTCSPGVCSGHSADDVIPFKIDGKDFTNQEFYEWMKPFNPDTPYVYDSFEWSWCSEFSSDGSDSAAGTTAAPMGSDGAGAPDGGAAPDGAAAPPPAHRTRRR